MISRSSLATAGWLLVLAVIFAPWAYGATRPEGILVLNAITYTAAFLWLLGCLSGRTLPRVPWLLLACIIAILAQGWWMTWNAHGLYDKDYNQFAVLESVMPDAPGSVDRAYSLDFMTTITGLLLACMAASDLGRRKPFRQKLLAAMLITGFTLSLFGFWILLSKSTILWWPYGKSRFMFATYRYHANAGAFLNLVWPLAIAAALITFLRTESTWRRLLTVLAGLTICVAVAVNASKGAQAVAALMFFIMLCPLFFWRKKLFPWLPSKVFIFALGTFFCILIAFALFIGVEHSEGRWVNLWEKEGNDSRLRVYKTVLNMPQDAGYLGWGPATFQTKFPSYNALAKEKAGLFWTYAHEDYLQTLVEWGYVGCVFWSLLVAVGGIRLFFSMRNKLALEQEAECLFALGILLSLGGIFAHALMDFPLQVPSLQLYTLLLLGLAWGSPDWIERRRRIASDSK